MQQRYFIGNWKENKTFKEIDEYFISLELALSEVDLSSKKIIVCPSFPYLLQARGAINKFSFPIFIGAQDISQFASGAYTGEVSGQQIRALAEYVIVGHSERRRYLHETNEIVSLKVKRAKEVGLIVILCVQDENEPVVPGVDLVAFEPVSAIGTGNPEDPERITHVFQELQKKTQSPLLYGGSINPATVGNFANIPQLSGFLIGGASLDPESFSRIIAS